METRVPPPDAAAVAQEAEAKRGVYLSLPWLTPQGEGTAAAAAAAAPPSSSLSLSPSAAAEPDALSSTVPYPRILVVDSWPSLRAAEQVNTSRPPHL